MSSEAPTTETPPSNSGDGSGALGFEDAVRIARGCFDYSGGYGRDQGLLEVYHHGIQTVINALEGAQRSGMSDLQSRVLHSLGRLGATVERVEPGVAVVSFESNDF